MALKVGATQRMIEGGRYRSGTLDRRECLVICRCVINFTVICICFNFVLKSERNVTNRELCFN